MVDLRDYIEAADRAVGELGKRVLMTIEQYLIERGLLEYVVRNRGR